MAKKIAAPAIETPGILPLPEPVIRHHSSILAPAVQEWIAQNRIPPVLLMTGASGVGKRELGWYLAQWILCERGGISKAVPFGGPLDGDDGAESFDLFGGESAPTETAASRLPKTDEALQTGPCGKCTACERALHGTWVDFAEILPEEDEGTLKIDQFRKLKASAGFGAHQGSYRITLIPNADRMTPQAANSVLKLLEEPPAGWVFLLTASDPTLVLPTVLSRCQQLRLRPFTRAELEETLAHAGVEKSRRAICAELAQGSWRKGLALAGDEGWEQRQWIFDFLAQPAEASTKLIEWAAQGPRGFDLLVDQLEHIVADLTRWSLTDAAPAEHAWLNADGKQALAKHAQDVSARLGSRQRAREFWTERAFRLARARGESLAPLNRKLLIQDLLLPWLA